MLQPFAGTIQLEYEATLVPPCNDANYLRNLAFVSSFTDSFESNNRVRSQLTVLKPRLGPTEPAVEGQESIPFTGADAGDMVDAVSRTEGARADTTLGTATADANGEGTISLSRPLIAGETIVLLNQTTGEESLEMVVGSGAVTEAHLGLPAVLAVLALLVLFQKRRRPRHG
jgi:hypothetical protein